MSPKAKVFVTTGTGHQGSAVALQLSALNYEVHTNTRSTSSPTAQLLSKQGVILHQGSWDDISMLTSALKGCTRLFLNLMPDSSDNTKEVSWAQTILSLAVDAGVQHVIYSSVFNLNDASELPPSITGVDRETHFSTHIRDAKAKIDDMVREAKFKTWTIVRPGYFMANLILPKVTSFYPGAAETGVYTFGYLGGKDEVLAMVDHEDIGRVAVKIFSEPEKFHKADFKIVSQLLRLEEAVAQLAKAAEKKITARYLTGEEVNKAKEENPMLLLNILASGMAKKVDMNELRRVGIDFETATFEQFLKRDKAEVDATFQGLAE
ncbi:hypothetical protein QBC35DRAFT_502909 [Podospora australis]|uniref:NmrA-like domain-containing protein n=1 Tax=Podospora australis TaxID=1536484 RepID=A0AAN6WPF3_9PEZI|nr:hypothetical protein QBC35DRAFT_502909 [Podospora australis]